jgi:hypothetical protein
MIQLDATHMKLIITHRLDSNVVNYRTRCAALKREMKTVKFGVVVMCVEVC